MSFASFRSLTSAMRGKKVLDSSKIPSEIIKLEPFMTKHGCAYGIQFDYRYTPQVQTLFQKNRIHYTEIVHR